MVKRAPPPDQPETAVPSAPAGRQVDPHERERFLRPQPPLPVPPRTYTPPVPGLLARSLLGARVYSRGQR
jgi:hypothetical protein